MLKHSGVALVVALALAAGMANAKQASVGSKAPLFVGTTVDGKTITFDDLRGNVVIVNFWATWCAPCRVELPLLETYMRAREKNGLRIVAVTMDAKRIPDSAIKDVQGKLSIPLFKSFGGDYSPIRNAIPTNYVIDRAGVVRYAKEGSFTLDKLNEILVPLLNEPMPSDSESPRP